MGARPVRRGALSAHDQALRKCLVAALSALGARHLGLRIANGFVTLSGSVPTFRQKERVLRLVLRTHGVRAMKDLMSVVPPERVTDRQIALHIRQALDAHAELPLGTAVVDVRAGVAQLRGHVRSAEERFLAENVASHCRGVKRVFNDLTVDRLEEVSDEAAARAVREALALCEDPEAAGVSVSCADGRVCLRGAVSSILDRHLAEELARLQTGVCAVEDHLEVRPAGGRKR